MALNVLKFGGTSVADLARLENVANIVRAEIMQGNQVVVVVSAMAGTTDHLVGYSQALSPNKTTEEHDVVASAGEQVTAGLCSLALQKNGLKAQSLLAWQIPIYTDSAHSNARILKISTEKIFQILKNGFVPVIAGFQGVNMEGRLTTIGRGGSDITAVAVASALNANRCDIYTDVDGVYTADPRIIVNAKRKDFLSYEEMFEMASAGAKVLHARAVEIAMKNKLRLRVLSSMVSEPKGTEIVEEEQIVENRHISGIVHSMQEAKVTVKSIINEPGVAAKIYSLLSTTNVPIDMMTQSLIKEGVCDMSGMINRSDIEKFQEVMKLNKNELGFSEIVVDKNVAKITIVGMGLRSNLEVPAVICKTLANEGINIHMIYSSEIKMSVVINQQVLNSALIALHNVFELENEIIKKEAA